MIQTRWQDHTNDLINQLQTRFPDDETEVPYSEWIERHTSMRGRPFSLTGFEFQRQIADDLHPDLWVVKLSQIGLTEIQIRKYLAILKRMRGTNGIMTFPTDAMRDRNSQTRIKPLVEQEAAFSSPGYDKPIRHKGLYQIDESYGYVTGSTEGDATSINASFLMHDELDLTDQSMISLFRSRLQGARDFSMIQRYSTPTYLGYGIDAGYAKSDRHEFMVRCGCSKWQIPQFDRRWVRIPGSSVELPQDLTTATDEQIDRLDLSKARVCCDTCNRPLDLDDVGAREWVAEFPGRKSRGYRIRPFSLSRVGPAHTANTIDYIFGELQSARAAPSGLKGFYNTVLGEAFNDSNARITEEDIRAVMVDPAETMPAPGSKIFVGIDVGTTCHVVIGQPGRVFCWRQVPRSSLVDFIRQLHDTYEVLQGCIDRYPETEMSERIRDIEGYGNVIMPCAYAPQATAIPVKPEKDEFGAVTHYSVNRTQALDAVQRLIRDRSIAFSGYGAHQGLIVQHLRDMVRIEAPDTPPRWEKLEGNDHFFHALGYMLTAIRIRRGFDLAGMSDYAGSSVFISSAHILKPMGGEPRRSNRGRLSL